MTRRIDMEAFMLALRLRRKGIQYPDVEAVFGQIIIALVKTATCMLIHDETDMRAYREFLLSADSQQQLAMLLLEKLDKVDATKKSHVAFMYIKNIVQTRARNLVRNAHAAKRDARITDRFEDLDIHPMTADFWGDIVKARRSGKISTISTELKQ